MALRMGKAGCGLLALLVVAALAPASFAQEAAGQTPAPAAAPSGATLESDEVEDALALIRDGNVEAGTEMLRRLGELGNADAFFHLAEINRLGAGKDASERIALMYYRFAARLGHKRAALSLANILFFEGSDNNSDADYKEAIEIWQQYVLEGEPEAMYLLGMVYWNGEGGVLTDPVRGYGLMNRAARLEYPPALEAEPAMREQLGTDARAKALEYADQIALQGFDDKPLALNLVTDDADTIIKTFEESKPKKEKPEDWDTVWHLEVGFAMSEEDIKRLQAQIIANPKTDVDGLFTEVLENVNREGLYRLVFGPVDSMQDAVRHCVVLKRAGHDCFAKPPREE